MTTLELAQALLEDIRINGEAREILVDYGIMHEESILEDFVHAQEGLILIVK